MVHLTDYHPAELCGFFVMFWFYMIGFAMRYFAAAIALSLFVALFAVCLWSHTDFLCTTRGQMYANYACWFHWMLMIERWIIRSPRRYA